MIKTLVVLALAIIAGDVASYSEGFFRATITAGLILIYYDMPER